MVPESKNTTGLMLPYERAAMNGDELPGGLEYPDQVLYLCLRSLYNQVRRGIVTRETAILEKKKLLDEYRVYKFNDEMGKQWTAQIKKTELARAAYRKERTLENADRLLIAIEGREYGVSTRGG